jgi:DNA-binding response OmpR family regulator
MSTEDLLVKAWGYNTETDINSVWLYISYLRKRLSAMNSKVEIISKRNIGYKLEAQS